MTIIYWWYYGIIETIQNIYYHFKIVKLNRLENKRGDIN